ncbi:MAG TPA: hypothetical protein VN958_03085 [Chitinophagaceae bacterium]|nr:hypothetical protein [Chitinophagaceae bacterium]
MNGSLTKKINIFLTVDFRTVNTYFNKHDPSPIYKRQIDHKFEEYIMTSVVTAKRYSVIFYKLNCPGAVDKQYAEPLMYAIRRHFAIKKTIREETFKKFKRRSWMLLFVSLIIVVLSQAFLPLLIPHDLSIHDGLKNCLDVFSWVILWRPIYELIFSWNPHLKDIALLDKLATAEIIIIDKNINTDFKQEQKTVVEETVKSTITFGAKSFIST